MIQNGTPMGPGFFIFFNNLDIAPPQGFKGFKRTFEFEEPKEDEELLELVQILFTFLERR